MEEEIVGIFIGLIVLAFVGIFVYAIFKVIHIIISEFFNHLGIYKHKVFPPRENLDYKRILERSFNYYIELNEEDRTEFLARVQVFISVKKYKGNAVIVSDEMKVLIAASYIQLTFGLERFLLSHFRKIIVYPDSYYSKTGRARHKGEVNTKGSIILSWEHFKHGYQIDDDKYNLGLHEMSHALMLDRVFNKYYHAEFLHLMDKWFDSSKEEFFRIRKNHASFLRKYAGSNKMELFAVCVEHFFEAPEDFKERLPQIYDSLALLLNQDTTTPFCRIASPRRAITNSRRRKYKK